jgi:hypothetical protein
MKRIVEIGAYRSGDSRLEVLDLADLDETVNEKAAVFVGHTTVTGRIKGRNFSESYQVSRAYMKQQSRWRIVASQRARMAKPGAMNANRARTAAA